MITSKNYELGFENHLGEDKVANVQIITLNNFSSLESYINKYMSEIVRGEIYPNELTLAKLEIINLMSKKTSNQKIGLVAEFFTHVVLRNLGFRQESIFSNLEESSLKKGFDGLYSHEGTVWIAESKSGYTTGINHRNKISEALSDLNEKLEGRTKNNPFKNATYHMIAARKKPPKKLKAMIIELSDNFTKGNYPTLDEYNIIPVSTLFVGHKQNEQNILDDISVLIDKLKYNQVIVICIDNLLYSDFLVYLGI
jgi:hypothetical protein